MYCIQANVLEEHLNFLNQIVKHGVVVRMSNLVYFIHRRGR